MSDVTINVTVRQGGSINADLSNATVINARVEARGQIAASVTGGAKGDKGDIGNTGATGATGAQGDPGIVQSLVAGSGITIDDTDPANPEISASPDAVTSVNAQTGVVVLDADDIDDTATTNKFTTAGEITKLSGIETGADVTDATNVAAAGAFMKATDDTDDITEGATNKWFTGAEETKLAGIETAADVTDAANVGAAGAFMKSVDDTDDITVGATNKFATAAEKTKLGHITVTQAVDLDTMESDIALKAPLASPALTGNPTAPTQSGGDNSTKIATTAYVDALIAAQDAMVFKGVIDASSNPNYPAADKGWTYRISVAGKIGGASGVNVEIGDILICLVDGSASGNQATVGANWNISQTNIDGAVIGPAGVTDDLPAIFDGTTGRLIKSKTYAAFKILLALVKGDVGLGNADNTSDANKPVSTATQTALDDKVTGPSSSIDNGIVRYDSTTGKLVQGSNSYISDNGSVFARGESATEVEMATMGYGVTSVLHNYTAAGTIASPTAPTSGSLLGGYGSRPFIGGGVFAPHSTAAIHFIANEDMSASNQGTTFRILVTPTGTDETNRIVAQQWTSPSTSDGGRWQADFTNATHRLRAALQTSTTNGNTSVSVIPNGTATQAQINMFNNNTATNAAYTAIKTDTAASQLLAGAIGSGTALPVQIIVNNSTVAAEFGTDGNLNKLMVPTAQARKITTGQTLTTATYAAVTFNSDIYDTDAMHDTGSNTSRFVAPVAGKYRVSATINYDANSTGVRIINFRINGSSTERYGSTLIPANAINNTISTSTELNLAANDYVEVFAYQNSGGNLDVTAEGVVGSTRMTMTYIGV